MWAISRATADGKLRVEDLHAEYEARLELGYHSTLPKVVSIAQSTEYGTLYTNQEVKAIADWCHSHDMYLHMDGCRLPNALVALDSDLVTATRDAGVDVLCFGGAKNGLMNAEAVIIFNAPEQSIPRVQKQLLQLSSKMRYVSAQFIPYLTDDLWRKNAEHANTLAKQLADALVEIDGVSLTQALQTNQVFLVMPTELKEKLHAAGHHFYDWDVPKQEVRLVTAWDNKTEDIQRLMQDAKS
ncbi:MAG TPA: beta-eliminating lyase-related protein [Verrucomicrobiae bacterium]|nr:beta-eliminating lyase-related protein [Verrucomicrobiae bacterium]